MDTILQAVIPAFAIMGLDTVLLLAFRYVVLSYTDRKGETRKPRMTSAAHHAA